MIAFPSMLVSPAEKAGIKVPEDTSNYSREEFPHFFVFAAMQLGASMPYPSVVWDNAHVIAALSDEEIKSITPEQLLGKGFQVGRAIP